MNKEIPITIIISYIYNEIKKRNKGPIIRTKLLKEIIKRHFICEKNIKGGNMKGVNSIYIYDIIDDLINFNLIKRLNHGTYEIIPIEKQDMLIKSLSLKVEYLKNLNKKGKSISEWNFNDLNEKLLNIIELIDNSEYEIIKSDCKKRLRHFPY